jgi:putative two-component system response regulator
MVQFVLLVDDDRSTRSLLDAELADAGFGCHHASDAPAARRVLAEQRVDVVLCDVELPGESGLDLLEELASDDAAPPVVMLSGHDDAVLADRAFALGAYGYLVKHVNARTLGLCLRGALRRRERDEEERRRRARLEDSAREGVRTVTDLKLRLRRSEDLARHAREDMALRLAQASEARDKESAGHIERMSRYCELLAEPFGLHPSSLRIASTLHDIGKVAVPDSVLLKPDSLTPEERAIMQTHTVVGHRLLAGSGSTLLHMAATIALTHHERFDGAGYPHGLTGEAIPLEGRVAAIADVFDALTSDRVYRRAFPVDEALRMMWAERGRHFDPSVLDTFMACMPQVEAIRAHARDLVAVA